MPCFHWRWLAVCATAGAGAILGKGVGIAIPQQNSSPFVVVGPRLGLEVPLYRFLARHHVMHHRQTGTNFNVVLPLADYIVGTVAKPKETDIAEMKRLGYVDVK